MWNCQRKLIRLRGDVPVQGARSLLSDPDASFARSQLLGDCDQVALGQAPPETEPNVLCPNCLTALDRTVSINDHPCLCEGRTGAKTRDTFDRMLLAQCQIEGLRPRHRIARSFLIRRLARLSRYAPPTAKNGWRVVPSAYSAAGRSSRSRSSGCV
jgi:hypothetical protein